MKFKSMFAAFAVATGLSCSSAVAQSVEGEWRCTYIGGAPLGFITMSGTNYRVQGTNTAWEIVPNTSDGEGTLRIDGHLLTPLSGPLVDNFKVTGAAGADFINFNNAKGNLFTCLR